MQELRDSEAGFQPTDGQELSWQAAQSQLLLLSVLVVVAVVVVWASRMSKSMRNLQPLTACLGGHCNTLQQPGNPRTTTGKQRVNRGQLVTSPGSELSLETPHGYRQWRHPFTSKGFTHLVVPGTIHGYIHTLIGRYA